MEARNNREQIFLATKVGQLCNWGQTVGLTFEQVHKLPPLQGPEHRTEGPH